MMPDVNSSLSTLKLSCDAALGLFIAIVAAELFNQSNWQRVYACRTDRIVKRAFSTSILAILPMILLAGVLGLLAMHFNFSDDRAFFSLMQQLSLPLWVMMVMMVLALALVMSTLSSLLNGIASVLTVDLIRLFPQMRSSGLLRALRILTVIIGIPAIVIAEGYDVLYLFLLADLVCAGAFFPVAYGFYSQKLTGSVAFWSTAIGIATGALFFPKPDFTPWLNLPFAGDLLVSFVAPVVVSAAISLVCSAMADPQRRFDFDQLQNQAHSYIDRDLIGAKSDRRSLP